MERMTGSTSMTGSLVSFLHREINLKCRHTCLTCHSWIKAQEKMRVFK